MDVIKVKVVSYNLHKGKSSFGSSIKFDALKQVLQNTEFDIGLFQEVLGYHRFKTETPHQIELLADKKWRHFSFAKNSVFANYDHGNALLSKYPITNEETLDLSYQKLESRCAILTKIALPHTHLYCICTHLSLWQKVRMIQAELILDFINTHVPIDVPLILGGDFNDVNGKITKFFCEKGGFAAVGESQTLNSYPSFLPILPLDRILCRNLKITSMQRGSVKHFGPYSDHLPIFCELELPDL